MGKATRWIGIMLIAGARFGGEARAGDFASAVVEYSPAPGQRINLSAFNQPELALGAPAGGGTLSPDNTAVVTLGGFGGSITLGFSETVVDDPRNPFGLDAIVFSNAFWVGGNANRRWCEAGVIEISRDANGNGVADDAWFVIRGSHLATSLPATVPADHVQTQMWDSSGTTPTPPANVAWYPNQMWYPGFPGSYATTTFRLPALFDAQVVINPNGIGATLEGVVGYADVTPTLVLGDLDSDNDVDDAEVSEEEFYTRPDNPYAVGITPGSGGGDAFDIAWAVDPVTGAPAELDGFDFVRISTGANFVAGALGEVSTDIAGVSRVRADETHFDITGDGLADLEDLYAWESVGGDLDGDGASGPSDRRLLILCVRRAERQEPAR